MKIPNLFDFKRYKFYIISTGLFIIWLTFFDRSNLLTQFQMALNLRELREEKTFYEDELKLIKKEQKEVLGNSKSLEKFGREKYLLKNEGETVYIVVDENDEIKKDI